MFFQLFTTYFRDLTRILCWLRSKYYITAKLNFQANKAQKPSDLWFWSFPKTLKSVTWNVTETLCATTHAVRPVCRIIRQSWRSVQDLLSLSSTLLLIAWMNPALPVCNFVFTDNYSGLFSSVEGLNLFEVCCSLLIIRGWEEKIIKGLNWVLRGFADPKSTSWG